MKEEMLTHVDGTERAGSAETIVNEMISLQRVAVDTATDTTNSSKVI